MRKAYMIVDMQNDFTRGALPAQKDEFQEAGDVVAQKAADFVRENIKENDILYVTQDTHFANYLKETQEGRKLPIVHCQKGTWGHDLDPAILSLLADGRHTVSLSEKSTFAATSAIADIVMQHSLQPFDEIIVMGICTEICVVNTVLGLKGQPSLLDVEVKVYADGCAGLSGTSHKAQLELFPASQVTVI